VDQHFYLILGSNQSLALSIKKILAISLALLLLLTQNPKEIAFIYVLSLATNQ
jgi:hypothetical protein